MEQLLKGTQDWQPVILAIPPAVRSAGTHAGLFLEFEGTGACWFDEVGILQ